MAIFNELAFRAILTPRSFLTVITTGWITISSVTFSIFFLWPASNVFLISTSIAFCSCKGTLFPLLLGYFRFFLEFDVYGVANIRSLFSSLLTSSLANIVIGDPQSIITENDCLFATSTRTVVQCTNCCGDWLVLNVFFPRSSFVGSFLLRRLLRNVELLVAVLSALCIIVFELSYCACFE